MNFLTIKFDEKVVDVSFTKTALHLVLADGREISAPLEWQWHSVKFLHLLSF